MYYVDYNDLKYYHKKLLGICKTITKSIFNTIGPITKEQIEKICQ